MAERFGAREEAESKAFAVIGWWGLSYTLEVLTYSEAQRAEQIFKAKHGGGRFSS
jgi:hypothetical protein